MCVDVAMIIRSSDEPKPVTSSGSLIKWVDLRLFGSNMEGKAPTKHRVESVFRLGTIIDKTIHSSLKKDWAKTSNGKTWYVRHKTKTW
ncbi:hypothetical protein CaLGV106 [Clostera anastomosis granulovirus A]|uniref:Uncharacterized protein n=1 Tax=Clostera anastomosis granulovirus A TaxID=1986289 RepID=U5KBV4_9BBAC|nr:hypothetical protein CaLGV106 [Clostera anastomosis granulovirus Henan]AGQ20364.1 hypothetical protein CaLGV106 [Clostera anastomosis granulovirus Henan]